MSWKGISALLMLSVALVGAAVVGVAILKAPPAEKPIEHPDVSLEREIVARVDGWKITRLDIRLMSTLRRIQTPEGLPDYGFLRELLEHAVYEKLLDRYGAAITAQEVEAERQRVDRETRDPDTLKRRKMLLEPYRGKYERLNLRPEMANQKFFKWYYSDQRVHARSYREAQAFLARVQDDPGAFERLAKERGVYSKSDCQALPPHVLPPTDEVHRQGIRDFIATHLNSVKPGEIVPQVIEMEYGFLVARLLAVGENAAYDVATFAKEPFDTWFRGELKTIQIEILDPELRKDLMEKAKGNPVADRVIEQAQNPK